MEETNFNQSDIYKRPQAMFSRAFSFDGRIRRLEYFLSVLLSSLVPVVYVVVGRTDTFMNADAACLLSSVFSIVLVLCYWFLWAQGVKRCHDLGRSGWFQFIPFYGLVMFFCDGDGDTNRYGYPPKQTYSVDAKFLRKNIAREQTSLATFYVLLMMLWNCQTIANYLSSKFVILQINENWSFQIDEIVDMALSLVYFVGYLMVFHYKKMGVYITTVVGAIFVIWWFYGICTMEGSLFAVELPMYSAYGLIFTIIKIFGFAALYPVLSVKKNGVSIWDKMEVSFGNTDWKSFFLYFFMFEMAALIVSWIKFAPMFVH